MFEERADLKGNVVSLTEHVVILSVKMLIVKRPKSLFDKTGRK
jgi:hypothetical protein